MAFSGPSTQFLLCPWYGPVLHVPGRTCVPNDTTLDQGSNAVFGHSHPPITRQKHWTSIGFNSICPVSQAIVCQRFSAVWSHKPISSNTNIQWPYPCTLKSPHNIIYTYRTQSATSAHTLDGISSSRTEHPNFSCFWSDNGQLTDLPSIYGYIGKRGRAPSIEATCTLLW